MIMQQDDIIKQTVSQTLNGEKHCRKHDGNRADSGNIRLSSSFYADLIISSTASIRLVGEVGDSEDVEVTSFTYIMIYVAIIHILLLLPNPPST